MSSETQQDCSSPSLASAVRINVLATDHGARTSLLTAMPAITTAPTYRRSGTRFVGGRLDGHSSVASVEGARHLHPVPFTRRSRSARGYLPRTSVAAGVRHWPRRTPVARHTVGPRTPLHGWIQVTVHRRSRLLKPLLRLARGRRLTGQMALRGPNSAV